MLNKRKIVASIEARMTSSRLPGKVLMNAIDNISMLQFMIERVRLSKEIDDIIVATTTNKTDQSIIDMCSQMGVKYYRGSENDVLGRVLEAHKSVSSDIIVELTGDCQLIDPTLIDKAVKLYIENDYDYVSNCHLRSYPIGLDVQVFSKNLLEEVSHLTKVQEDREHVSLYIYKSGKYKLKGMIAEDNLFWPELRITLDDKGDYKLIKKIIEKFYPSKKFNFSSLEIIEYLKKNEYLLELTKNVRHTENKYEKIIIKKN